MSAAASTVLRIRRSALLLAVALLVVFHAAPARAEEFSLYDVPGYYWHHGCSPTAGMMVIGYWDARGYQDLIPGSNDWRTNNKAIKEAIASKGDGFGILLAPGTPGTGHIPDYAFYGKVDDSSSYKAIYPDMSSVNPAGAHSDDCLADFMGTSRSALGLRYGATSSSRIGLGMVNYAAYRGYTFSAGGGWPATPSWTDFIREIQFGRPVVLGVDTEGNGKLNHSVTAIGYRTTNGYEEYFCRTTWEGERTKWAQFRPISDAYEWGVGSIDTLRPSGTWDTAWRAENGLWHDISSWDNSLPDENAFTFLPTNSDVTISSPATAWSIQTDGGLLVNNSVTTQQLRLFPSGRLLLNSSGASLAVSGCFRNDGQVTQQNQTVSVGIDLVVGGSYTGDDPARYTQSGGLLNVSNRLVIGEVNLGDGTFRLAGGELRAGSEISVGEGWGSGSGRLEWFGGVIDTPKVKFGTNGCLVMGFDFNVAELYEGTLLNGAVLEGYDEDHNPNLEITNGATATHSTGSTSIAMLTVGSETGRGTYLLSGTAALTTSSTHIGYLGDGEFIQTSGTHSGRVYLGSGPSTGDPPLPGGNGTYRLDDGRLDGDLMVGHMNIGTFTQNGGTVAVREFSVGHLLGSEGTYTLNAGTLEKKQDYYERDIYVGGGGAGHFIQNGGAVNLLYDCTLYVGGEGGDGIYELHGGSLSGGKSISVGWLGTGLFIQTGGTVDMPVGVNNGSYELQGGTLPDYLSVGGTFIHTGGTKTGNIRVAQNEGSNGTYRLSGTGCVQVDELVIGYLGTGKFTQQGGSVEVAKSYTKYFCLGFGRWGYGTYELLAGSLSAEYLFVGKEGSGRFMQSGGMVHVGESIGIKDKSTYGLAGGDLQAGQISVSGTFLQTGGTNTIGQYLYLGSKGTYTMSAGNLSTADFTVGGGTLNITDSAANIIVSNMLCFTGGTTLTAVPGATIHMTGAAFENESKDENALAGLGNLELIFEGGAGAVDPFEVASAVDGGFDLNFALGTLTVGGADVGRVRLVDLFDNGNRGTFGAECLFAHTVNLQSGSTLDLNGLRLYVEGDVESMLDGCVADGRLLDGTGALLDAFYRPGNDWTVVPEPATLALLALGVTGLILKRRRPVA